MKTTIRARFHAVVGRYRMRKRHEKALRLCGCVCFCPNCKDILQDQAECEDTDLVRYRCTTCGHRSVWNFDIAPCPILISAPNAQVEPRRDSDVGSDALFGVSPIQPAVVNDLRVKRQIALIREANHSTRFLSPNDKVEIREGSEE